MEMDILDTGIEKIKNLKDRELERQSNLQKKHENKALAIAENEQISFFERSFLERQSFIEDLLNQSTSLPIEELPEHFDKISKEILLLQKYVAASSLFLKSYFIKRCQNVIQDLNEKIKELEALLLPKKKFGFKNKNKPKANKETINGSKYTDEVDSKTKSTVKLKPECGLSQKRNEVLVLRGNDVFKKDVLLEYLTNCKVIIQGVPSTLFLNHLVNCQIFCGPVSTSIFAEHCEECTFVIACQQLRLHSSTEIDIYLHVTSRAIMEDCNGIRVAPYNWTYDNIDADFKETQLDVSINNWRCIDDFNWLNAEKRSPNWCEIDEDNRIIEWT